jgi:hypothetical protein
MRRAFNVIMRIITTLLGLVMIAMGSTWAMQGLGVGPAAIMQGFMVNDIRWTYYGVILAIVGIAEIVWCNTRQIPAQELQAPGRS